ncbi:MAG: hypothetical protein DRQ88_07330 [Epsilonproteobacteria bacterium]|nr:MAG: hypothetical protein DRQ89_07765 [Campylobacterota bacterium]RLA66211.1 MAG: hypothetical protein DRQ88_07330 [Campylobacterota bacterium]
MFFFKIKKDFSNKYYLGPCLKQYNKYDDTCYYKDGTFEHFYFLDGQREVYEKGRGFGFYGWINGYYAGLVPYYWYYPRGGRRYVPDGTINRRVHGK